MYQHRVGTRDDFGMNVSSKGVFPSKKPKTLHHPFCCLVWGPIYGRTEKKSFDIISAVKGEGQFRQLSGFKSSAGNGVGPSVHAVGTVVNTSVGKEHF
jgi:hypothetical protein